MPAPSHDSLLHHDSVSIMTMQEQGQNKGDEEEHRVHDPKDPARLEHRTVLIDINTIWTATAKVSERAKINVDSAAVEAGAVGIANAAELVIGGNERANKAEIDKGDKEG